MILKHRCWMMWTVAVVATLLGCGETRAATNVVAWGPSSGYVSSSLSFARVVAPSTNDFDGGGTSNDTRYSVAYDETTPLNPGSGYFGTNETFYGGISHIVYNNGFSVNPSLSGYNCIRENATADQINMNLADNVATTGKRLDVVVLWKKENFLALSGVPPVWLDSTCTQLVNSAAGLTAGLTLRCLVKDSGNLYVSSNNLTSAGTLTVTNPLTETWAKIDTSAGGYTNMHQWILGAYSTQTFHNVQGLGYYVTGGGTAAGAYLVRVSRFSGMAIEPPNSAPTIDQGAGPLTASMDEGGSPTAWSAPALSATDTDGNTLTWGVKNQGLHGEATVDGTGASPTTFTYVTTDPNYCGTDSFVVKVTDPASAEDTITVNVTINPRNDAPVCTVVPVVSGTHFEGNSLSTSDGTWNDTKDTDFNGGYTFSPSYAYHWQRANDAAGTGAADIGGATANAYTLTGTDVGKYVRIRVTCTDDGDGTPATQSADAYSTPWQLVTVNNVTPTFGQASPVTQTMDEDGAPTAWSAPTLTASDTDPGDTAILQWSVATQAVHGVATVSGTGATPTTLTYAPSTNYNGSDSFWVKVSDGKPLGDAIIRVDVTINARNDAPVNTVAPLVSGTYERGQALATTDGTWNDDIDTQYGGSFSPSYTYQWQRADDAAGTGAANIGSATANTYTLAVVDVAKYVRARVTCTDDGVGGGGNQSAPAFSTPWTLVASAPITWTGSDGTDNHWERTANWTPALAPTTGDEILFSGTPGRLDPYLEANYSISKLTFASGAASLALGAAPGATLTFTGNTISNASVNVQTNNMPMSLSSVVTMSAAAGDLVVGGALSGASGGITKTGVKALTLSGDNNSLAGGVTLSAGTLNINHNNALGSGALTIGGGTIDNTSVGAVSLANAMNWNASFVFAGTQNLTQDTGAVTLSGTPTVTVTNTLTVNGAVGGSSGLTKTGTGTLLLGGNNTFNGALTVQQGTLSLATLDDSHNGSGTITLGSGTTVAGELLYSGAVSSMARGISLPATTTGGGTITVNGGPLTFTAATFNTAAGTSKTLTLQGTGNGAITGVITNGAATSLAVTKSGDGAWTLSGNNTYSGLTTVSAGALTLAGDNSGMNGGVTVSGSATLNIGHAKALGAGLLTFANSSTFDNTSGSALTVTTDPVIKFNNNQTFTGTHDLDLGAGVVTNHLVSMKVTVNTNRLTIRGPIRGCSSTGPRYLEKDGGGTLVLLGNSTDYWGKTSAGTFGLNVVSGIVEFAHGALGDMEDASTTNITLSTGTTLRWVSGNTQDVSKRLNIVNLQTVTLDLQENDVSFAYALDNPQAGPLGYVSVTKLGTGTLTLTNLTAKYAGLFRIFGGTVVAQSRESMLSSGTIAFNSGTLKFGAAFDASTGAMTFNAGGATLDTLAQNITLANPIGNNGTGGFTKKGSGSLTLSATNSYMGGTTLDAGQLNINTNNALGYGAGALLTIKGGTTLDNTGAATATMANNPTQSWEGDFVYAGSLGRTLNLGSGTVTMTGSRQVTISAGNLTVGGIVGEGYALEKLGAGTLEITGASTYSGNTTITGGTLKLSGSGAIASSPVITVGGSGTLNVSGYTLASGQTLLGTGTVAGDLTIGSGSTNSPGASGAIGTMTQTSGTTTLAGGGTYAWELNSVSAGGGDQDAAGKGTAFDWVNGSGAALNITATSGSKFTIKITRSGSSITNWDKAKSYSWTIATAANGISGFVTSKFSLDTSAFGEDMGTGSFYLSVVNNDLRLNFTTSANNAPQIQQGGVLTTSMSEEGAPTGWLLTTNDVSAMDADIGDTLTWSVGTEASHGTAAVSGTGAHPTNFTYAPNLNYYGTDSFWVTVDDGNGGADTIEVQVTVDPVNDVPVCVVAPGITGTRLAGSVLTVTNGVWNDNADTNATYRQADFTNSAVFAYQWRRADDSAGSSNFTNLFNQTNATYTLVTPDDRYKWFSVQVSCTDTGVPGPGVTTVTNTAWLQETSTVPGVVVFSNAVDTTWGLYSNWKPDSVPTTTIAAVIGDTAVLSPATVTLTSGTADAKNLYLGTNTGSKGTLNITGGSLIFPATGKIVVAGATSSTGILTQTGGTITGITSGDLSIAAGSGSTGTVILGGTTVITSTWSIASGGNSVGTLTMTNNARWQQSGANTRTVGSSAGAVGRLNVLGNAVMSCLDGVNPRGVTLGSVTGSAGELMIGDDGQLTDVAPLTIASSGSARATVRDRGKIRGQAGSAYFDIGSGANGVGDLLLVDNADVLYALRMGSGAGSVSTLTMSNNAVFNQGLSDAFIVGNANKALATVYMNDSAILNPYNRGFVLGNASGSTGIVEMTGGLITNTANGGTFTVGNLGYGKMTIGGTGVVHVATLNVSGTNGGVSAVNCDVTLAGSGLLRVTTAAYLGHVAGVRGRINLQGGTWAGQGTANLGNAAGAEGVVDLTGGTWLQSGSLTVAAASGATGLVTVANCTQTNITGTVTVGGGAAGDRYGSIVVSNATFGGGTRVMVLTNGFVNLVGAGSQLLCNTFTNNGGSVTTHVGVVSSGVDVTNGANTSLVITNGGTMRLVFGNPPALSGVEVLGLRWFGNNHAGQLQGMKDSAVLSWADEAVGGCVTIYTNATYTMVGYVTKPTGTTFQFR